MRPTALRLVAASSLLLGLCCAAETRPRYGGTVRVQVREVAELRALVFETLVRLDDGGEPQPWLATTWESREDGRRWQFWLRRKVKFHDGTPLTPSLAAAGLQAANPGWRVRAVGD